ncbi:5-dehydro-4-deoxy-D-glucuronate isomerase [Albirhodobacter sp. R86504]|uniref:5-dehydro-4-deoxy-D-glucuronate isomerase n=1 Tax=Albirhodobacter sp. R86504 TaxID=3093848 RepID=UPI00366CF75A
MLNVITRHAVHQDHAKTMDTDALRANFMTEGLFEDGKINLIYTHYDRLIVGGAVPAGEPLTLDYVAECGTKTVLERREMGIVNLGGSGRITAGGDAWTMERGDVLYLGMGAGPITMNGLGRFYIVSAPAHKPYPNRLIRPQDSKEVRLGDATTSNKRVINQFIHPLVMESCQLVLGYTTLLEGSVWNTMPTHTHDRRMEAYLYYNMDPAARVVHLMGEPQQTRHLMIGNEQGAISPPWSIHAGAGTGSYSFVWAMAGDNTDFTDMDFQETADLK